MDFKSSILMQFSTDTHKPFNMLEKYEMSWSLGTKLKAAPQKICKSHFGILFFGQLHSSSVLSKIIKLLFLLIPRSFVLNLGAASESSSGFLIDLEQCMWLSWLLAGNFCTGRAIFLEGSCKKNACVRVLIGVCVNGSDCVPAYNMFMCLWMPFCAPLQPSSAIYRHFCTGRFSFAFSPSQVWC